MISFHKNVRRVHQVWLTFPLVIATSATVCPQVAPGAPVVEAAAVVVQAAPTGGAAAPSAAVVDAAGPILDGSWGQIAGQIPNLQVEAPGTSSFGAIYSLRGLANTPYFSDPAVTLYFDDIPLGGSFSYPTDLFGFATASVYRGPQPTEFGRAGDGGVIVLSPPNPVSVSGGTLTAGFGDDDAHSAGVEWAGAQGDHADANVAAAYASREGYIFNSEIGQRVDDQRAVTAFARERYHPTSASELSVEILADRHRDGAAPLVPLGGPLYSVQRSQEGETDTDMAGVALKGVFATAAGRFSTVTSYTNWRLDPYDDWLVLPPPLASRLTQSQDAWNEELRLASNPGKEISWDVGSWLSDATTTGAVNRSIKGFIPLDATAYETGTHDAALFGEFILAASPSWRVAIGARAEHTGKDYEQIEQFPNPDLRFHLARNDDALLPKLSVTGDMTGDTTASASISFGSRPGGYSAYTDNPAYIPFSAEHTEALEAGLQSSFAQKTVTVAARAFAYAIQNYQIERSFSAADYFVATAPRARSLGAEVEASWKPAAGWAVGAVAGLADVTLLEFHDPLTGRSYAGDRAPYAPAYTAGLNVSYRSSTGWFASGGVSATGKTFYTETENPVYAQAAYAVADARLGFETRRWRLTAYVDNAADKGYYSIIIPGVNSASPGVPRTAGAQLVVKF